MQVLVFLSWECTILVLLLLLSVCLFVRLCLCCRERSYYILKVIGRRSRSRMEISASDRSRLSCQHVFQTAAEADVRDRRQTTAHLRVQTAAEGEETGRLQRRQPRRPTPPAVAGRDRGQGGDGDGVESRLGGRTVPRRRTGERDHQCCCCGWVVYVLIASSLSVLGSKWFRLR